MVQVDRSGSFDPAYDYSDFFASSSQASSTTSAAAIETTTSNSIDLETTGTAFTKITTTTPFDPQTLGVESTTSLDDLEFGNTADSKTTGSEAEGDVVPIYWIAIAITVTAIAALLLFLLVIWCIRKREQAMARKRKKRAEREAENGQLNMEPVLSPEEVMKNHVRKEKEMMLRTAMKSGSVPVLQYTILETTKDKEHRLEEKLVQDSHKKLEIWKKRVNRLAGSLKKRDVQEIRNEMEKFKKLKLKDDARVYQQAEELLESVSFAKLEMRKACQSGDKQKLENSIVSFTSLNLPVHFTSVDEDYRAARSQLDKLNTHHKSQAQQEVEARINLNVASLNKDESAININMGILYTAGHTDADDDIRKGKRALAEIADEKRKAKAWNSFERVRDNRNVAELVEKLDVCREVGVVELKLLQAAAYVDEIKREDELLAKISADLEAENIEALKETVLLFREPDSRLVDKTGKVKEAEELIERRETEARRRREVGELKQKFNNAKIEGDDKTMSQALESLQSYEEEERKDYLVDYANEIVQVEKRRRFSDEFEKLKIELNAAVATEDNERTEEVLEDMKKLTEGELGEACEPQSLDNCRALLAEYQDLLTERRVAAERRLTQEREELERKRAEERSEELKAEKARHDMQMQRAILTEIDKLTFNAELQVVRDELADTPHTDPNIDRLEAAVLRMRNVCASGYALNGDDEALYVGAQNAVVRLKADKERRRQELMVELETIRQQMQLARIPENLAALQEGVKSMERIRESEVEFPDALTQADVVLVRECQIGIARVMVQVEEKRIADEEAERLRAEEEALKKATLRAELDVVRDELKNLTDLPDNIDRLRVACEKMEALRAQCTAAFPDDHELFHDEDMTFLEERKSSAQQLSVEIDESRAAEERLTKAIADRDFAELDEAIKLAGEARLYEDDSQMSEALELREFLDPKVRVCAIKDAARSRDTERLRQAIDDFSRANVSGHDAVFEKAERSLYRHEKQERRRDREVRRKEKAAAARKTVIEKVDRDLATAIGEKDLDQLERALQAVEVNELAGDELEHFAKAERLYDMLKFESLTRSYDRALHERNVRMLELFIVEAEKGKYAKDLGDRFREAKKQIKHLRKLNKLRNAVANMNRGVIAEVANYPNPPKMVQEVMAATLVLLGDNIKQAQNWTHVLAVLTLIGNDSITRRVESSSPRDISAQAKSYVESRLAGVKMEDVIKISSAASNFLAWIKCTLNELEQIEKLKDA